MQKVINEFFFGMFVLTYVVGLIFYHLIGFDLIDEICVACIALVFIYTVFKQADWKMNKVFLFIIAVFLFYLIYSFRINSNTTKAIFLDFFIQMKPYLAFFCVYQMKPVLSPNQKKILNQLALLCWLILLPVGLAGGINEHYLSYVMGHPTSYAAAITATALLYLFTCEGSKLNKLIFIALLLPGILSGRSKFYGFFVMACAVIFWFDRKEKLLPTFKNIFILCCVATGILFVTWHKIEFYFVHSFTGEGDSDYLARMALYSTSYLIFIDYFPFGSGFGSFGTHASGVYYSEIYSRYDIDYVWGLNRTYTKFITDTYYPSLAQFGVVGVVLFLVFWTYIIRKAFRANFTEQTIHLFPVMLCIVCFFLIENVADATFTGNRGLFMMLFLGYLFTNLKATNKSTITTTQP